MSKKDNSLVSFTQLEAKIGRNIIRTDLTRVIAIFMIIMHHGYSYYITNVNPLIPYNLLISSLNFFGMIGVALFFICSGANLKEKISLKEKFLKIYPAYIVCLIAWEFIQPSTPNTFIEYATLLNGFYGIMYTPLWFIPTLFGLYILYPILQEIIRHKKLTVIVIGLSFCGLLPAIILSYKLPLITTYPYTSFVLIALCPFILGMLTKRIERRYSLLILLFSIFWILSIWEYSDTWQVFAGLLTPFIAYGIFSLTANTIKTAWGNTTLILYLLHPFVISYLSKFYGWIIIPTSIPILLIASWYLTKLNNKFTNYLVKRINTKKNGRWEETALEHP
ncbi:MAG: acyltransferase family protein [Candidatus Lokiarchaeia archaeon]